ncbi:MAG: NAD-dependent DNA ligase LigA [Lachnospiraceae bacterium]|nr:NAD-dependent DNA ligase LigA [Lachnospiraceae bacterium]
MSANEAQKNRIRELVTTLNCASEKYYAQDDEIMSNYEYDRLYDELVSLETETGYVLANSPTVNVGYESVDELPKERHEKPMLSLGKTKDREELREWLDGHDGILSWKLDGLTVVITYFDGKLAKAITRGNGEIGEVVTNNARTFINLPHSIEYKGELVIRGEAVISYSDFEKINSSIPDETQRFKNPRNLCSGAVRQLDPSVTAKRMVRFFAFSLVSAPGVDFGDRHLSEFEFLKKQGFDVVDHVIVTPDTVISSIKDYEERIRSYDIPSDGLVLLLNEISYGNSLGMTAKFPRNAIAFKWTDETKDTTLRRIEWSASRTGLINPVAIFDPVELEGTTVSRASVHNISIVRNLKLGLGDTIRVYKANMIIPQIAENLTCSDDLEIPGSCPVCSGATYLKENEGTAYLYCSNPECPAKKLGAFTQFVSRDAMNMDGLSEATIEKFIAAGMIHTFTDLYHLDRFRDRITGMEGFGEKSYENLIASIEVSRNTELHRLLYAVGIENVGVATAKLICRHFGYDQEAIVSANEDELSRIDGIGSVIASSVRGYFSNPDHLNIWNELLREVTLSDMTAPAGEQKLAGLSFVVTGSLEHYSNRNELKEIIENLGGKVTGSVTGKTECLINNDSTSNSTKNRTARESGVKVLTEDEFIAQYID